MIFILLALVFVNAWGYVVDINVMTRCFVVMLCRNGMLTPIFIHDPTLYYDCNFTETQLNNMKHNCRTIQRGKKYTCNQCDCKVTINSNLQKHNKFTHESIIHICNKHDFTDTQLSNLKHHFKKYICNWYDPQVTSNHNWQEHDRSTHECIRYFCNMHDFTETQLDNI